MDLEKLEAAKKRLCEEIPDIRSLLIVKNGYLIYEEYFNGYQAHITQDVRSVTKSVLSILTGIAIKMGYLEGVNQNLVDIFHEYAQLIQSSDTLKKEIKIEHLLTMSSGLQDTSSDVQVGKKQEDYPDLIKALILELPVENKPGSTFLYDDGHIHILSGIISRLSKMDVLDFANNYLFEPLGIVDAKWKRDHNGLCYGGSGLQITPRDMAKIGYLYLNGGKWDGKQIVSEEWIKESIKPRFEVQNKHVVTGSAEYGYLWWIKNIRGYPSYFASGRGGQLIFIIPDLDMVIVTTADPDAPEGLQFYVPRMVIEENIIDAVVNE
jgi:CubicO group peptidase (beta-lactamase class C family)